MASIVPLTQHNLAASQLPPQPSKLPVIQPESTLPSPDSTSATVLMQPGNDGRGTWLTPSLSAVLNAYEKEGAGDTELLKALLLAKAKEDERLAALDMLRAEQLRAANTLALHQQATWASQAYGYPPFSPTSPPSSSSTQLSPHPWKDAPSYAHSGTFSYSAPPSNPYAPRPLPSTSASPPLQHPSPEDRKRKQVVDAGTPAKKVKKSKAATHEEAMQALRARCQRNQAAAALQSSSSSNQVRPVARAPPRAKFASPPPSKAYPSPPPQLRPLAQAATSDLRSTSSSPPLDYRGRFPGKDEAAEVRTSSIRMLLNGDARSTFARSQTSDVRSQ